jgi:NRPS condensation-like uncharacterized protein
MLQWCELHPYNAVHVVRIPAPLDLERLKQAVGNTLESLGLGEIVLNRTQKPSAFTQYEIRNTPAPDISILTNTTGPTALHLEIQRHLNTSFLCGPRVNPFRFFVQSHRNAFSLGLTYFHPLADAESIVLLLKTCVEAYGESKKSQSTLELFPRPAGPFLVRHPGVALRKTLAIPQTAAAMRRCYRPPIRNHNDFHNAFIFFSLEPERFRALIATSKSWDVTLNDLFLALLMKAVSPLACGRIKSAKRKRIGIGCIVNVRKDLGFASRPVFGLFLGSFVVAHEAPDSASLETIARDLRRQTLRIKQSRLPLGTPVELAFGRLLFSFFSTERQKKLYQKNYPLWGGITNMNLNAIWPQPRDSSAIDYFRAASTGPATPLVLSTTTVADRLNIGLTFRTTVFSETDIQQIKSNFIDCVNHLQTTPS